MRIVADENIPFAAEALAPLGDLRLLPGRRIERKDLLSADALVVRSVTRVDRELLEGTPVRFVGTATIGTDHVDLSYLVSRKIAFADAAGSNARSVAEYVIAALLELSSRGTDLDGERIGIVGVGNVGSLVSRLAPSIGLVPVEHDPPRALREPGFRSAPLEELLACRVITLHVPLVPGGPYPTEHLVDGGFLAAMRSDAVLLNTARGGVVDSAALLAALERGAIASAVLDVWEGEPAMPAGLLERCALATPHVAGYSHDGKARGTEMMAAALARHLGLEPSWSVSAVLPPVAGTVDLGSYTGLAALGVAVHAAYDPAGDDLRLRGALGLDDEGRRRAFDLMRKDYPIRREFPAYIVANAPGDASRALRALGFEEN